MCILLCDCYPAAQRTGGKRSSLTSRWKLKMRFLNIEELLEGTGLMLYTSNETTLVRMLIKCCTIKLHNVYFVERESLLFACIFCMNASRQASTAGALPPYSQSVYLITTIGAEDTVSSTGASSPHGSTFRGRHCWSGQCEV